MATFRYDTRLPFSRQDVFAWYTRPGALTRLHPPFAGPVVAEPEAGIEAGASSTIGINPPGIMGTALAAAAGFADGMLPVRLRPWVRWVSAHTEFEQDRRFTDEMVSGAASRWRHERIFEDADDGGTVIRESVEYQLPAASRLPDPVEALVTRRFESELRRIFSHRERQTLDELTFHRDHGTLASQQTGASGESRPTVAVTGATGMIGEQVCAILTGAGAAVRRLTRSEPQRPDQIRWDPDRGELDPEDLREVDVVVHLAGHPLAARFTEEHKRRVMDSRVRGTDLIARTLAGLEREDRRGRALISGSAVGYYGAGPSHRIDDAPETLTEDAPVGEDFLARVCLEWEAAAEPAEEAGLRVATVRTGIVQSPSGGVLQQLLPIFAAGLGGPLGRDEWQPWISLDDIAGLIAHLVLDPEARGPVNGAAPEPCRAADYAKTLGRVLRRPAVIPVPSFGPQLLLGREGAEALAEADQRVSADRAEQLGYRFRHRDLETGLRHVLGRSR
ncbi:MAG: TIGR01777 family oxidoreductase [Nesterenkonia sp.]|nr:TIGR01777 family oxidoreductase [Nesterenkonia sp.]